MNQSRNASAGISDHFSYVYTLFVSIAVLRYRVLAARHESVYPEVNDLYLTFLYNADFSFTETATNL